MDTLQRTNLYLGPFLTTILLGFITFLLIIWYSSRKQSYWKNIGIAYAKPYPIIGSVIGMFSKPLQDMQLDAYNEYGRIYGHYEGNRALLSVADPEILRSILVKDFHAFTGRRDLATFDNVTEKMLTLLKGEDWKRVRTIVSPTFTTGKIRRMMSIFGDCSRTLVQNFKEVAEKGQTFDAKTIYGAFAMDMIASSAFSTKIDSHNDPNNIFVTTARNLFTRNFNWRLAIFTLMPDVLKFFRIGIFSQKSIKFFSEVTLQIIEERKRTGQKRNDFLQLLMDTTKELSEDGKLDLSQEDDIVENYAKEEDGEIFKSASLKRKTLSHEELIAQCVVFFIAGYDTVATTLSFASYLLAVNPDIQEKLIEELDIALKQNNGELTYEAIQSMKYLDNVISETLRLYPPAIRLERVADEDFKLGETGLIVPKGMVVTIPIYAMHRDPKFFPNPEKFDPDRFTPEERAKRDQYAYLPFGAGPKNCVGMRFALMEMKVCLAHVLSNFRITKCPQTKVPLEWTKGGFMQPTDITLSLEIRKDTESHETEGKV